MSYDEALASRCRTILEGEAGLSERKMFGGLSFLLHGNMVCGVQGGNLVVRLGSGEAYDKALRRPHVRPMDFTGRTPARIRLRLVARAPEGGFASNMGRDRGNLRPDPASQAASLLPHWGPSGAPETQVTPGGADPRPRR